MNKNTRDLVQDAKRFAIYAHGSQLRQFSMAPYVTHTQRVAERVRAYGGTETMIAAAHLHDVLEDTDVSANVLLELFGEHVHALVQELTDQNTPEMGNRAVRMAFECNRLAGNSPEAQTIKLADLIDNTLDIVKWNIAFARTYVPEKKAILAVMTRGDPDLLILAHKIVLDAEKTLAEYTRMVEETKLAVAK